MGMNIDNAYVCASAVDKIYLGEELLWPELGGIAIEGAPNGVYILRTDNRLYTREEWDTSWNEEAVGVAVIADNCKFVIAPTNLSIENQWSPGGSDDDVYGATFSEPENVEYHPSSGLQNTLAIVNTFGVNGNYAALVCRNYVFKNGEKGYLGSVAEFMKVLNNKDEIINCSNLIDAQYLSYTSSYWTSSIRSKTNVWIMDFYFERYSSELKRYYHSVWPFAQL